MAFIFCSTKICNSWKITMKVDAWLFLTTYYCSCNSNACRHTYMTFPSNSSARQHCNNINSWTKFITASAFLYPDYCVYGRDGERPLARPALDENRAHRKGNKSNVFDGLNFHLSHTIQLIVTLLDYPSTPKCIFQYHFSLSLWSSI